MSPQDNLDRMKTLDDGWNAQDWQTFRTRHTADTKVFWPGKTFELDLCTVARWKDGEIVEENLFYDQIAFMRQVGIL